MFVRKSTFDKLQKESNFIFAKLVDAMLEVSLLKLELSALRAKAKFVSNPSTLTPDEILKIIACTHPDKHNGDKQMGDITAKLLEMRKQA